MAELIARSRRYNIAPAVSIRPFDALAESIAYQQLSGKAAATIFGRVRALYPKRKWLDPEQLLATPDETLRAAGLRCVESAAGRSKCFSFSISGGRMSGPLMITVCAKVSLKPSDAESSPLQSSS